MRQFLVSGALALFLCAAVARGALIFHFTPGSNVSAQVASGVNEAALIWSTYLRDDLTLNININAGGLASGVTGSSNPSNAFFSYSSVRTALAADATSLADLTATAHLPAGTSVDLLINRTSNSPYGYGSATPYLDNNGDANNNTLRLTRANAKALGLVAHDAAGSDGTITFSTSILFDYDRSDGIAAGKIDFTAVALHEIGHLLGFFSGVDVLDRNSTPPDFAPDVQFPFMTTMDLYRYSAASTALHALDWSADTRGKYLSMDAGATSIGALSTGTNWGDGYGASHWKDNLGLGLFDPTIGYGEEGVVSAGDLQVLDVIGYSVVPEPGSLAVIWVAGVFGIGRALRPRARTRKIDLGQ